MSGRSSVPSFAPGIPWGAGPQPVVPDNADVAHESPDLSTLAARAIYASKVVQELRGKDPQFAVAYFAMGYEGKGLCLLLHEAGGRAAEVRGSV